MQSLKWLPVVLLLGVLLAACSSPAQPTPAAAAAPTEGVLPTTEPPSTPNSGNSPTARPDPANPAAPPTETGAPAVQPEQALTLTDAQGSVTVEVTPLNLSDFGDTLDFEVAMNTHSVDLSMDLSALAVLQTDTGKSVQPLTWDGASGGHHVSGTLSFPAQADGAALLEGTTTLTLVLKDVDAPERVFTWEVAP